MSDRKRIKRSAGKGKPRKRSTRATAPEKSLEKVSDNSEYLPRAPSAGSLPATTDALSAYLREIRNLPKLTREQEHELAVRYQKEGDLDAAYEIVSSNLWLVVKIARDYQRAAKNLLDLVQEGNIGLMEAVKNYDPYRGVRFPSYAVWWIKAYIIRYLIANFRMVKIGTTQAQRKLFFNLKKEKEKLEREGFFPGPKLLAERLNVREKDVIEMEQRLGGADVSVDAPTQADTGSEANLHSVIPDAGPSAEELLAKKEFAQMIEQGFAEFASTLKENEQVIFDKRMVNEDKATLQELSDELGISRERVRQIENKIKDKLREYLSERFQDGIESLDI